MSEKKDCSNIQRITLIMVLLNAFATPIMLSAVNVALPAIAMDLSMSAVLISWVPMAYLMASAMFVLIFGRLADMLGRKRIFLLGTVSVIVTSLIAAFSSTAAMLIAARILQGTGAAMLYATQVAIVSSVFPPAGRGRVIGLTVSMIYLGLTIGPLVGGYAIDLFGWRASFLVHIPLAIIVLYIGFTYVNNEWLSDERGSFDLFGAIMYALAILIFCLSISGLPSPLSIVFLFVSLLLFVFFFLFERAHKHPIFDVTLFFTNRGFTFSCLAALIIYTATFANVVQVSLYLQYLKGMSATMAGIVMMCQPMTMALFSPLSGRLSDRFEPKHIASLGMLISGTGLILLAGLRVDSSIGYLIAALVITGLGFGLFSSPNANAVMGSVEKRFYGSVTGVLATMRIAGQLSSMVLVTLIFALIIGPVKLTISHYAELEQAIRLTFTIAAVLCVPGLYFSVARGRMQKTRSP